MHGQHKQAADAFVHPVLLLSCAGVILNRLPALKLCLGLEAAFWSQLVQSKT
jgi:hypothetical protein